MLNRLFFTILCLLPGPLFAQRLTAFQLSNYAGTNGVYLNPSSIADSRWGGYINLTTVSFQANPQPRLPLATVPFSQANLKLHDQELALNQVDFRGPGFMVQILGNQALAITTRYRADLNLNGSYDLVQWVQGNKTPLAAGSRSVQLDSHAFGEIALSYAASVIDRKQHYLKIGATYKYLRGLQTATMATNGRFEAPSGQLNYSVDGLQTTYSDLTTLSTLTIGDALYGSVPGAGVGFDLGFTYEFRPKAESFRYPMDGKIRSDASETKYRFRIGASLLDIGGIRYRNASTWTVQSRAGSLQQTDVQPPKTPSQVRDAVARSLGIVPDGTIGDLTQRLPQTLAVQLDAQLVRNVFFGATWWKPTGPTAAVAGTAQHRSELISFGPRYESPELELAVTGNYWRPLNKFSVGAHVRVGLVTVGSDNLQGFFSGNGLATHLFASVAIPIRARRPKDRDRDAVSDRRDLCPDVAGIWALRGCPDSDGDGIQDDDDDCPQKAGPVATNGCPDTDGDGILDKNDACPNEAGPASSNGCPDTDGDGVFNNVDECPTVAGLSTLKGCPDADADGLRDNQDSCPTEAGLKELDGCPLKAIAYADAGLSVEEKTLLNLLSRGWLRGPVALTELRTYLEANKNRLITLEFSGSNQDQLERIVNRFEDELGANFSGTQQFRFTIVTRTGEPTSLRVGIKNE
jgi:hypothetical protein